MILTRADVHRCVGLRHSSCFGGWRGLGGVHNTTKPQVAAGVAPAVVVKPLDKRRRGGGGRTLNVNAALKSRHLQRDFSANYRKGFS